MASHLVITYTPAERFFEIQYTISCPFDLKEENDPLFSKSQSLKEYRNEHFTTVNCKHVNYWEYLLPLLLEEKWELCLAGGTVIDKLSWRFSGFFLVLFWGFTFGFHFGGLLLVFRFRGFCLFGWFWLVWGLFFLNPN